MYSIYQFVWMRDLFLWKRDINLEYKDRAKTTALVINYEKRISSDIILSADLYISIQVGAIFSHHGVSVETESPYNSLMLNVIYDKHRTALFKLTLF